MTIGTLSNRNGGPLVIHAYAKSGGTVAATKAQQLLTNMHKMYANGNVLAKPDTITVSILIHLMHFVPNETKHNVLTSFSPASIMS